MNTLTRRIVQLYERGLTAAAIARDVDRSRQRVHQILLGSGHHQPRKQQIAERRKAVAALTRAGLRGTQIAGKLMVLPETVYRDQFAARLPRSSSQAAIKQRREQVEKLARQGLNGAQIAHSIGHKSKTIYRDLKALGMSARSSN